MLKRQRFRILLYLIIISTPFLLMVIVNENAVAPTFDFRETTCTRYCHNHACPHTMLEEGVVAGNGVLAQVYNANIKWLKNNPFGMSYQEVNLAIYVIGFPGLMAFLLWGLIRKRRRDFA